MGGVGFVFTLYFNHGFYLIRFLSFSASIKAGIFPSGGCSPLSVDLCDLTVGPHQIQFGCPRNKKTYKKKTEQGHGPIAFATLFVVFPNR